MKASTIPAASRDHYFVPQPSLYPVILSGGMFLLALGFIQLINNFGPGKWVMLGGTAVILYVLFGWFGKVIGESQSGSYRDWEDRSFRYGMIWFIATEVMFFAAFFGALFYVRVLSVPELGGMLANHGTIDAWATQHASQIGHIAQLLQTVASHNADLAPISVALRELRHLA